MKYIGVYIDVHLLHLQFIHKRKCILMFSSQVNTKCKNILW